MKIEIDVDTENNEGTDSPYWLIIDPSWLPKSELKDDPEQAVHTVAGMIKGPFFSRKAAQSFLNATHYNFSKNAKVYCHSGYWSSEYKNACREAEQRQVSDEKTI
jgi:hypothetical protein